MRRAGPLAAVLAAALASGCAGGPTPRTHYYRVFTEAPAARAVPYFDGVLAVERLGASGLLQTRPILKSDAAAPTLISQYDYHSWTEAPPVMLQRQLTDYLRSANVARAVVTPEQRVEPDYVVSGRVRRLEHVNAPDGARVALEVELELSRHRDGELLWQGSYRTERPATGPDVQRAVESLGSAVGEVYARFVGDITARPQASGALPSATRP